MFVPRVVLYISIINSSSKPWGNILAIMASASTHRTGNQIKKKCQWKTRASLQELYGEAKTHYDGAFRLGCDLLWIDEFVLLLLVWASFLYDCMTPISMSMNILNFNLFTTTPQIALKLKFLL